MEDSIKEKDEIILGMWKDFIGIETFDDFKKVRKNGLGFISNITSPHQSPVYEQDDQPMQEEKVEIIETTKRNNYWGMDYDEEENKDSDVAVTCPYCI